MIRSPSTWLRETFSPALNVWGNDEPLLKWNNQSPWTISQSLEGAFAFGGTGAGKTTGFILPLGLAMLRSGYGALLQTTKSSDVEDYRELVDRAGRRASLIQVGPNHRLGFNLIDFELAQERQGQGAVGLTTENVVRLFDVVAELAGRSQRQGNEDSVWTEAAKQLLRNAVNLVFAATGRVEIDDLLRVVQTAPHKPSMVSDPAWRRDSYCAHLLARAQERWPSDDNVQKAADYFLVALPGLAPETRASVGFNFSAVLMELVSREPLRSMFFGQTDYTTDLLLEGAIILVDAAVDPLGQVGRLANGLLRWAAQRTLDRRNDLGDGHGRPVLILWDECQKTLRKADSTFQSTARSRRCCTLAAAQDLPTLREAVGEHLAEGFLTQFNTKVFFRNQDPKTNRYMADLFGKYRRERITFTYAQGRCSSTVSDELDDVFQAQNANYLESGGRDHRYIVTGILTRTGQRYSGSRPYIKISMPQYRHDKASPVQTAGAPTLRPIPDFSWLA